MKMETGNAVIISFFLIGICYIIYDSIPSKYTKLAESFGGFMNRSLVRIEYEKSPLHTIVYGGTGTGKTYFIRQYLKLYSVQNQEQDQVQDQVQVQVKDQVQFQDQDKDQVQDQRSIVIVCKHDRDWIDPESSKFYTGFNKCDINMIIKNNMHKFQNCVIVLDDMGDRLNKDIGYYFTEGRHYNQNQNQNQDQGSNLVNHEQSSFTDLRSSFTDQAKNIIIVCKDDRDWIDAETGEFYIRFITCDINMITSKKKSKFKDSEIVLGDRGDNLNKDLAYYFTEGRHYNIQMIVICHKPAQIFNTARMSCDTIYLTSYNGADLFKKFYKIYKCEHNFNRIISELNSDYHNCTDEMSDELRYGIIKNNRKETTFIIFDKNRTIYESRVGFLNLKALSLKGKLEREDKNELLAYMKPLMINATDRNNINHDYYQFYFIKFLH